MPQYRVRFEGITNRHSCTQLFYFTESELEFIARPMNKPTAFSSPHVYFSYLIEVDNNEFCFIDAATIKKLQIGDYVVVAQTTDDGSTKLSSLSALTTAQYAVRKVIKKLPYNLKIRDSEYTAKFPIVVDKVNVDNWLYNVRQAVQLEQSLYELRDKITLSPEQVSRLDDIYAEADDEYRTILQAYRKIYSVSDDTDESDG